MMSICRIPAGYEDGEDGEDYLSEVMQKITVVPDITVGAGLNNENFDRNLSSEVASWFFFYKDEWNSYKRMPSAQHNLKAMLMTDEDPLLFALKLFANCPGCNNLKNKSLALFILETVCDLHKTKPEISTNCTDNTRMIAFNFVKTCGIVPLCKAVISAYELKKIRDLLVPKIKDLIAAGHIKDAAHWTMHLQITHIFGIFDIVFPLILQDKVSLAEEYLNVAKDLALPTVKFLDSLLDKQKTVIDHCEEVLTKYEYKDVKYNILTYRPMSKLVTRLAKKYKIDAHDTPNLNFTKACSYLHYLWRKYRDGGMSHDAWVELAHDAAVTKPIQMDLIKNVVAYGDIKEAGYWISFYKIPLEECPDAVLDYLKQNRPDKHNTSNKSSKSANSSRGAMSKSKRSNSFKNNHYLTLNLPVDCIIIVDDRVKFLQMLDHLEGQLLIAFDSEWKPTVCNENVISVLQMATMDRVYLLDCLSSNLSNELWQQLGRRVFNNLEILKIGFSLHQDLRMLHKSLPLELNLNAKTCYLDLRELWRRLKYLQIVKFPFECASNSGESLCTLTEICLGKKLDKSNQFSNWANRPLRHDQVIYAALDAHCLLLVYQVVSEILVRMGLDVDQVVDEVTTGKTGYLFQKKRVITEQNDERSSTRPVKMDAEGVNSVSAKNENNRSIGTKFICDTMMTGLSKEFRKLGIDCVEIINNDLGYYIELARKEHRYILTRDSRYDLFVNELPPEQCLQIPSDSSVDQVLNIIRLLDIKIYECNLFTRCLSCNSNEFIFALRHEMQTMRFGQALDEIKDMSALNMNPYGKTYHLLNVSSHIVKTKTTYRGKFIKLNRIRSHILRSKEYFYICDNCGICTWDGAYSIHSSVKDAVLSDVFEAATAPGI
ncbi:exonuclease mut-7 homolog [Anastrepha ludens]|uniref:exonuclease mut-7 homolog n=1 Tax=Anastrepha ludens TaxID=28586 RepID=UPI0023AE8E18|nr:exonuclease mut-7 homolog [Anastrepha ludens]XP_053950069.1 exonuclease mut-7 homolog [Anastrepha ludens]